jgi:hypothetical protein
MRETTEAIETTTQSHEQLEPTGDAGVETEGMAELDEWLGSMALSDIEAAPPEVDVPARLEPVGYVTRELKGPDGSLVQVEVPIYAASEGKAPESASSQEEGRDGASDSPVTEDLDELLAAEDADD